MSNRTKQPKGRRPAWNSKEGLELFQKEARNYNQNINRRRREYRRSGTIYLESSLPEKSMYSKSKNKPASREEYYAEMKRMQRFNQKRQTYDVHHQTEKALDRTISEVNAAITAETKKAIEKKYNQDVLRVQKSKTLSAQQKKEQLLTLAIKREASMLEAEKNGRLAGLPEKLDKKTIIAEATNESDLRRRIQIYRRMLEPGALDIVSLNDNNTAKSTKWKEETIAELLPGANTGREKEKKKWENTNVQDAGKVQEWTNKEMGKKTAEFDPLEIMSDKPTTMERDKLLKQLMRETSPMYWDRRMKITKDNYMDIVKRYLGNTEVGKILLEELEDKPLSEFRRTLMGESDLFDDVYTAHKSNPEGFHNALAKVWSDWHPNEDMDEAIATYRIAQTMVGGKK